MGETPQLRGRELIRTHIKHPRNKGLAAGRQMSIKPEGLKFLEVLQSVELNTGNLRNQRLALEVPEGNKKLSPHP